MATAQAALDTDFINGIIGYENGDGADLLRRIFAAQKLQPVICSYVKTELEYNQTARQLIAAGDIVEIPLQSYLPEADRSIRKLYRGNFETLFKVIRDDAVNAGKNTRMSVLDIENPSLDIFQRLAGMSFGEIHTMLMAAELGIPVICSNDSGAKTAAKVRYPAGQLTVLNALEVEAILQTIPNSGITGDELRYIRNIYKRLHRQQVQSSRAGQRRR